MMVEAVSEDLRDFAMDPSQIFFCVEISDTHGFQVREPVSEPDDNDVPLAKKRQVMQMRLARLVRARNDRRLQFPCPKPAVERFGCGVDDLEMNARMPGADADQKLNEIAWRDRAHHAELQPRLSQSLRPRALRFAAPASSRIWSR